MNKEGRVCKSPKINLGRVDNHIFYCVARVATFAIQSCKAKDYHQIYDALSKIALVADILEFNHFSRLR